MNERALDKFLTNIVASRTLLNKIRSQLDDHLNVAPDAVNWNHVGDSQHVKQSLREVLQFLEGKE